MRESHPRIPLVHQSITVQARQIPQRKIQTIAGTTSPPQLLLLFQIVNRALGSAGSLRRTLSFTPHPQGLLKFHFLLGFLGFQTRRDLSFDGPKQTADGTERDVTVIHQFRHIKHLRPQHLRLLSRRKMTRPSNVLISC